MSYRLVGLLLLFLFYYEYSHAQLVPEVQVIFYTLEWEGDRDDFGRPVVSDDVLNRMKFVSIEEAWGMLRSSGYHNKFEGDWHVMYPDRIMTGRAFTAAFMPSSPELESRMESIGNEEGFRGQMNQWPIYMLKQGDVYVADGFGKIKDGTLIGDNLGQAIFSNSGNGPVFYGSARDLDGLRKLDGFNAWVKDWHPSYIQEMMLISINGPTRIGEAVVLPGDVVLAAEGGVVFIPPHLAENVVVSSEVTRLTDIFRQQRIREGSYKLDQVYGVEWTEAINEDFYGWLQTNRNQLHHEHGVGIETIDKMTETKSRNWRSWIN